jgi:N-acetylmuramoyl-L-alanine amidase
MAKAGTVRRRLLREAVADNRATMLGGAAPRARQRRRWRVVGRAGLWLGLTTLVGTVSFLVAARGFSRASAVETVATVAVPPPAPRPAPARGIETPVAFDPGSTSPLDRSVLPFSVRRVVIDAGHGGEHTGTSSTAGLLEKEITLDVARRLADLLKASGFEPILTRTQDATLSLEERGRLANEEQGDIFISIHVNWLSERQVRAVETFYLGPTEDRDLQRLAARENQDSEIPLGEFRLALERVYADVRRAESRLLARSVQQELLKSLQTINPWVDDRGVKSAPFDVLIHTRMPAILAEVGCLSNEEEAALFESPDYRQYLAEALLAGIRSYALSLNPNLALGRGNESPDGHGRQGS